jgi:hypothetical protein
VTRLPDSLTIPARFNGPDGTGNGGYSCGLLAAALGVEVASVSLRVPPPLERSLDLVREDDHVELRDGDKLVAEAVPDELLLEMPAAVPPERAAAASQAGRREWTESHPFPGCVVCGPQRKPGDGMRVFPGRLDSDLFAAEWTPDDSLADGHGRVRPECVWAALDCPTSAPVANFGQGPPLVLARLTARLGCPVMVGESHALVSWPLGAEGRKRHAACALFDSDGRLLCASRALWIELRTPASTPG